MKFRITDKTPDRVRIDTEYYPGGRQYTLRIRLWLALLILVTVILGLLVLVL